MADDPKKPEPEILPPTPNKTERSWTPAPKAEAPIWTVGKTYWGKRVAKAEKEFLEATEDLAKAETSLHAALEERQRARDRANRLANDPSIIGDRVEQQLAQEAHERDLQQRERDLELQEADLRRLEADTLRKEKEAELARREEALKNPRPPKPKGKRPSADQRAEKKFDEDLERIKETGFADEAYAKVKRIEQIWCKEEGVKDKFGLPKHMQAQLDQMYQAARDHKYRKGST